MRIGNDIIGITFRLIFPADEKKKVADDITAVCAYNKRNIVIIRA